MTLRVKFIVGFVVIGGLLFFLMDSDNGTMDKELSVEATNLSQWTSIQITDQENTIALTKDGVSWLINNNLQASDLRIDMLKDQLAMLSVRYPITGPKGASLTDEIKSGGTHIKAVISGSVIYDVYLQIEGNIYYAYVNGAKYPNALYNSNGESSLLNNSLSDPKYWRNKTILSLPKEDIAKVAIDWNETEDSFELNQTSEGELKFKSSFGTDLDKDIAKFYLYEFKQLEFLRRISNSDTCIGKSLCTMDIEDASLKSHKVEFYQFMDQGSISKSEMLVYLPLSKEWGVVSFLQVDAMLRKASFFQKNNQ